MKRLMLKKIKHGWKKVLAILLLDLALYNLSILLAIYIKHEFILVLPHANFGSTPWLLENAIFIIFFFVLSIPLEIWNFTSLREAIKLGLLVFSAKALALPLYYMIETVPYRFFPSIYVISTVFVVPLLLIPRAIYRLFWEQSKQQRSSKKENGDHREITRVLMIGAGNAADKVLREIELHPELQVKVVGLVDDNPSKLGSVLRRKRVLGTSAELPLLIKRYQIQEVLITMPSASGDVIRRILSVLAPTQVRVKTLPGIWEMVEGIKGIETYRQVKLEDLLERSPIRTNVQEIGDYLRDQVILVTGAGGSIGSELVRQLVTFSPRQILLLGRGENRIFKIDYEVRNKLSYPHGIPLIINICDHERVNALLESYHPSIIFHCAAHKHVPLMELHPEEAIKNNVIATKHLLEGAIQTGVKRFINISTDKAVNPISVMGASKRIVELLISAYNQKNGMICTSVRFGNVLGSNSSVVELFSEQLQLNRTIKVTDERMERYFMLIPEAVELVLQAGALAQGSEIFVLNMGERVNIHEFAQSFIKLSGMELGKDAFIEIIGNRGNEKLSEDLWSSTETIHQTSNPWIFQIPCTVSIEKIESQIQSYPLFRSDASRLNTDDTRQELFKFLRQIENI